MFPLLFGCRVFVSIPSVRPIPASSIFESKHINLKSDNNKNIKIESNETSKSENSIDKELNDLIQKNESIKIGISKIIKQISKES
ncbi:MAG: hypothetical protein ACJA1A_001648 [Saprospiraceae bacterium]|jgi:hypothetical protein|tara:strand:- start:1496 stop:1750 length:255 start_codon:yes stop_codon:yes gene_type:complete